MTHTYDVDQFRDNFEHEFTWLNGFMRNVGRFGDRPALYSPEDDRRWTYRELNTDANRLAHALKADGVGKNSVIMYMLFNSPEFVFAYLAGHKLGAIGCPVNYRLSAGELALLIDDSEPAVFIYDAAFAPVAEQALAMAGYKPGRVVLVSETAGTEGAPGATAYADYVAGQPETDPVPAHRKHIYDETTRLYTSGTTNRAKAVPINDINEVLSAHDVLMHFPLNANDRTMNMTPWFHRGGLHSGGPTPTLYAGGEVVILREFNPRRCLELAAKERVTFLIGVPSIIALLARAQEHTPVDLSSLRGIVTMGSPFEKAACERYMELFTPNIFNGYGTTETFWNTFLRPYDLPGKAGSAGMSCTDDDVRLVRILPDGGHAEPDDMVAKDNLEIGEIIIRAPAKSAGCYVNNEEMSRRKFYKGFHYTGDIGTWDKNEFVTVVSRKDDMIICAGENIYPTQVEAALNEHPKVAECAVVGRPDRLHGQCVAAYVVPADESLTVEELRAHCVAHPMLPPFKRPRFYTLVKELPHTATGKLLHYKVREQAERDARG
ncbi:MAG: AMP-binding protein [Desulfovibrio sp.]|uniref:class I adenylate-forming enzyme family protein n=1 Tax=Desulfovibrio sp. TaxID=885 RepID=UPI001A65AE1C|nr:AMP-binding protein [Desulfovibrio sp.]MBD5417170.1 AMP-binding protein [Desulfovibrio sp.]